jgi:aldose 1-epimerase
MEEGYPGTVDFTVTYTLDGGRLAIDMAATLRADAESTYINMTSHPYFNLSPSGADILDHVMYMPEVACALAVDDSQIPTGTLVNTATFPSLFFTSAASLGSRVRDASLKATRGIDHYYLASNNSDSLMVTVTNPSSNFGLRVYSTAPGLQVYTGNWLDASLPFKASRGAYSPYAGVAIEPSAPPNAINMAEYAHLVTVKQGETWKQQIVYELFSAS